MPESGAVFLIKPMPCLLLMHQSILALPIPPGTPLGICTFFFFKCTIPQGYVVQLGTSGSKKRFNITAIPKVCIFKLKITKALFDSGILADDNERVSQIHKFCNRQS